MKAQRTKREWHIAQTAGAWRVYDPEQRQHGGRFATADAARDYMTGLTGKRVEQWRPEPADVEVMA